MKTFTPDSSIASDVIPSPNHGDRNNGRLADMILLHYTGMPDGKARSPSSAPRHRRIAHYIVLEDGRIVQCVPEAKRAWHAGVSFGPARKTSIPARSGSRSSIAAMTGAIRTSAAPDRRRDRAVPRHHAPPQGTLASRTRAFRRRAGAQKDPGEKFPWHSLANSGVGHWVQPAPIVRGETLKLGSISDDVAGLQAALAKYGYKIPTNGKFDGPTMEVVTAFQRHFRPARVDGIADHSTVSTLHALLASLPADAATTVVAAR